jgi:hypothetical protein
MILARAIHQLIPVFRFVSTPEINARNDPYYFYEYGKNDGTIEIYYAMVQYPCHIKGPHKLQCFDLQKISGLKLPTGYIILTNGLKLQTYQIRPPFRFIAGATLRLPKILTIKALLDVALLANQKVRIKNNLMFNADQSLSYPISMVLGCFMAIFV